MGIKGKEKNCMGVILLGPLDNLGILNNKMEMHGAMAEGLLPITLLMRVQSQQVQSCPSHVVSPKSDGRRGSAVRGWKSGDFY
jgi:hypothetical protein